MAWSISYLPPKEPDLLDDFFLAVGKALYLATSFEAKCRSVLLFTRLVDHIEQEHNLDAALTLTNQMKARMLGGTIRELKGSPHFAGANLEAVDKARESRNFIAHEAADLGYPLCYASSDNIAKRLSKLRVAVSVLAAGDNVVSRWLYEIEEKHPAGNIRNEYIGAIDQWIFDGDEPNLILTSSRPANVTKRVALGGVFHPAAESAAALWPRAGSLTDPDP